MKIVGSLARYLSPLGSSGSYKEQDCSGRAQYCNG